MDSLFGLVGILVFLIGVAKIVISIIKKQNKKNALIITVVGLFLFVIGVSLSSSNAEAVNDTESSITKPENSSISTNRDSSSKAESESIAVAESKAKAESESIAIAESKAKAESESIALAESKAKAEAESIALAESKAKALEPITISGFGDTVTDSVLLSMEYYTITSSDDGSSNFIVHVFGDSGSEDGLINEIGPYSGQTFSNLANDSYKFEVKSEGNWSITLDPNVPSVGQSSPLSGFGDKVVFLEIDAGSYTLNASDDGDSNFIVHVNGGNSLINEIGPYEGQSVTRFQDSGVYVLDIVSEGNWSLNFVK